MTTLSNGIRVCTEKTNSQTATIGVHVGAGSRQDTLATSGAAHALRTMLSHGTSAHSKSDFAMEIETMGARFSGETGREHSNIEVTCFKNDVRKVVSMLGDAVSSANLDAADFELCKQQLAAEHDESSGDYQRTTLENCHFNAYRDHMMGQPIKGESDNLANLTVDDLQNYRTLNYFGDNIVIVGTGNVNHDEFVNEVNAGFQSVSKTASGARPNTEKNVYTPSLLFIRDDEMYNSNIGVFYDAPSVKHQDYYSFLLLKHMFGSYRIDQHAEHLNDVKKQYNSMHALLGDLPDVTMAESHYFAYSDSGIWGNYFFGNEVFTRQMNYCGVCLPTIYSHYINDVEVVRGRNHLYNHLLKLQSSSDVNKEIGAQMLNLGRRLNRSEIASRVAHIDGYHIKHLCNEWFYDAEPCFTNWGPIEQTSSIGSYKFFKVNTMSTVTNAHHSLFN
jgi:processing peptidase subunit beta